MALLVSPHRPCSASSRAKLRGDPSQRGAAAQAELLVPRATALLSCQSRACRDRPGRPCLVPGACLLPASTDGAAEARYRLPMAALGLHPVQFSAGTAMTPVTESPQAQ